MKKVLSIIGFVGVQSLLFGCVGEDGGGSATSASEQCTQSGNVWNPIKNECTYCPDGVWKGSTCVKIPTFIQTQLTLSMSENSQIIDELLFQGIGQGKTITYTFTNHYNESYYTPRLELDSAYIDYVTANNISGYSNQFTPTQYLNSGESSNCINRTILQANESCAYQVFYYVPGTYTLNGLSENQKTFTPYKYIVRLADWQSPTAESKYISVERCFKDPRINYKSICPESWAVQLESLGLYSQIKNIPTGTYTANDYTGRTAYSDNGQYVWKCFVDNNGDVICNRFGMTYNRNSNTLTEGNTIESSVNFGFYAAGEINKTFWMLPVNDGTLWISYTTSTTINRAVQYSDNINIYMTFDELSAIVGEDNSFWVDYFDSRPYKARYNPSTNRFEQSNITKNIRNVFNNGIVLSLDFGSTIESVACWTYKESGADWSGTTLVYESAPVEIVNEPYIFNPNANFEFSLYTWVRPTLYKYQDSEFRYDYNGSMKVSLSYKVTLHNGKCRVNLNQFTANSTVPTSQWYLASPYVAYPSTIYGLQ